MIVNILYNLKLSLFEFLFFSAILLYKIFEEKMGLWQI